MRALAHCFKLTIDAEENKKASLYSAYYNDTPHLKQARFCTDIEKILKNQKTLCILILASRLRLDMI